MLHMSEIAKRDLRKALKALYDDLREAENGPDRNTFGFIHRLKVIHENLEEMIPRLLAVYPHLGEFGSFGDFETEYSRRGDSGMDQMLKSEIKKLAIEIDADLEPYSTTKETIRHGNPIKTLFKHNWTRGEKIGIIGIGFTILGIVLIFLV